MPTVPAKIYERLQSSLKRFQPFLSAAKSRDAGEADTSTIVKDMLSEVFGYDKYTEITSEYMIKGTHCDLAVKLEAKLRLLIEVKAIGLELKDAHVTGRRLRGKSRRGMGHSNKRGHLENSSGLLRPAHFSGDDIRMRPACP